MGLPRLGGQGGKGGDVWVVAKDGVTLKKIKDKHPHKRFVASVGMNSSVRALKGGSGADCEIVAPPGITVITDTGKVIGELDNEGQRVLVARGGRGGCLASGFLPSKGQTRHIQLDLKLIADFGLVGFPNAGKSSLLSVLSQARPQIASYPFTTLRPEIGKIMYEDYKQVSVADLPGLIEGAHLNKGMGHKFLKHVERTRQLLFVVDVSGFQLSHKTEFRTAFEAVQLLTKELQLYQEELLTKPALLAVNKMDLPNSEERLNELVEQLRHQEDFALLLPEGTAPRGALCFRHIIPVSASTGHGVAELKACLRRTLDEQADAAQEEQRREKLRDLRPPAAPVVPWRRGQSQT
ncbi:GTPBA protein, partial [Amia calva]|nr:GTPBA protein [Amia calva]